MTEEQKQQAEIIKKDVRTYASLEAVSKSDGGQLILKGLRKDIVAAIEKLASQYKTAPEIELRASCAALGERLTLLRAITRAPKNKKGAMAELDLLLSTVDSDGE